MEQKDKNKTKQDRDRIESGDKKPRHIIRYVIMHFKFDAVVQSILRRNISEQNLSNLIMHS